MYIYQPLSQARAEIRLLRLVPRLDPEGCPQLSFELRHFSLASKPNPVKYAALSYVWGDVDRKSMVGMLVNGHGFPVSHIMYAKLQGLFETMSGHGIETSSWIWVDYICINQSDPVEKSWQVAQMRDIYSLADCVYMLLGPGNPDSDAAMDYVSEVGPRAVAAKVLDRSARHRASRRLGKLVQLLANNSSPPTTVQSDLTWICYEMLQDPRLYPQPPGTANTEESDQRQGDVGSGLEDILLRDYWHRVWIVQEVVSATNALVVCGSRIVTLDALEGTISALNNPMETSRGGGGGAGSGSQQFGLFMRTSQGNPKILHGPTTTLALSTRRARRENDDGGGWMTRLACLLYKRSPAVGRPYYSASDPRDMIFALLGVTSDRARLGLEIDYRLSPAEVLTTATRALIRDAEVYSDQPFHLDCCVPRRRRHGREEEEEGGEEKWGDMPSWVPDWEQIGQHGVSIWRINHQRRFHATRGMRLLDDDDDDVNQRGGSDEEEKQSEARQRHHSSSSPADTKFILDRHGCYVDQVTEVMPSPQYDSPSPRIPARMIDVDGWFRSIVDFTHLPSEPSPAEDYVWRTVRCDTKGEASSSSLSSASDPQNPLKVAMEAKLAVIRRVMRRRPLIASELSKSEEEAVRLGIYPYPSRYPELDTLEKQCAHLSQHWPRKLATTTASGRTLFKTAKGMLGLGHDVVRPGDIVALLAGLKVPVILRPEIIDDGGGEGGGGDGTYSLLGDAYVDGIMHGEFLATGPRQRIFRLV